MPSRGTLVYGELIARVTDIELWKRGAILVTAILDGPLKEQDVRGFSIFCPDGSLLLTCPDGKAHLPKVKKHSRAILKLPLYIDPQLVAVAAPERDGWVVQ